MLQRIQTLFLMLAVAALAASFVFPIATIAAGSETASYTNYGLSVVNDGKVTIIESGFIYIVAGAAMLFLLFALTQYRKRKLQVSICRISYIIILAQLAMCFFMPDQAAANIKFAGKVEVSAYGFGFYAPIIALVFTFLAERFIRRDEALVRSADRLR